jgi:hypothetical protein
MVMEAAVMAPIGSGCAVVPGATEDGCDGVGFVVVDEEVAVR